MNKKQLRAFLIDVGLVFILTAIFFAVFRINILNWIFIAYLLIAFAIIFSMIYFTHKFCKQRNINPILYQARVRIVCFVTLFIMPLVPIIMTSIQISVWSLEDFKKTHNSSFNKYNLRQDIDLSNAPLTCNEDYCYYLEKLDGILYGNGYTFKNAKGAIFANLGTDSIDNLKIEYHGQQAYNNFGVLASTSKASISKVTIIGDVLAGDNSGGIVSLNKGTIYFSAFQGTLSGNDYIGGIAGNNKGLISACEVLADISGRDKVAGITGKINGEIDNCYFKGQISGNTVGGLTGEIGTYRVYNPKIKEQVESPSYVASSIVLGKLNGQSLCGELVENHIGMSYANFEVNKEMTLQSLDSHIYVTPYDEITAYAQPGMSVSSADLKISEADLKNMSKHWYVTKLGMEVDYWHFTTEASIDNPPTLKNIKR